LAGSSHLGIKNAAAAAATATAAAAAATDYFTDITTFVEPGFCRRVCEAVFDEFVKRCSSAAVATLDKGLAAAAAAMGVTAAAAAAAKGDLGDVVLTRLANDERSVHVSMAGRRGQYGRSG
jgi:hypothetical protein